MSLTFPFIDQAITQTCAFPSSFCGMRSDAVANRQCQKQIRISTLSETLEISAFMHVYWTMSH